jgi:hypothetical protein
MMKNRLRVGARNDDAHCASAAFGGVHSAAAALRALRLNDDL